MRKARCTQKPANQLTTRILRRFGNEHQGPRKPWEGPPGPQNTSRGFPYESRTKSGHSYHQIRTLFTRKSRITPDTTKIATVSDSMLGSTGPNLAGATLGTENASQRASVAQRWGPSHPQTAPKGAQMLYFTECSRHAPKPPGAFGATCPAHLKAAKGVSKVPH